MIYDSDNFASFFAKIFFILVKKLRTTTHIEESDTTWLHNYSRHDTTLFLNVYWITTNLKFDVINALCERVRLQKLTPICYYKTIVSYRSAQLRNKNTTYVAAGWTCIIGCTRWSLVGMNCCRSLLKHTSCSFSKFYQYSFRYSTVTF